VFKAFMALAIEVNLIDQRGFWTGNDIRDRVRRFVSHVITWAMRGWNPFEQERPESRPSKT
jgi:hypothetical protein